MVNNDIWKVEAPRSLRKIKGINPKKDTKISFNRLVPNKENLVLFFIKLLVISTFKLIKPKNYLIFMPNSTMGYKS